MQVTDTRPKSKQAYKDLCKVIPAGVSSAGRAFKGFDEHPLIAKEGKGDLLTDIDGNTYIDYCCSWGALIHGHANPAINKVVIEQVEKGSMFGLSSEPEEKLANHILSRYPCIDQIRFVNSGTEATMSAIRLARGYTGKEIIIKFIGNYHGHADFLLVQAGSGVANISPTSSSAGIPTPIVSQTYCLPYNDTEAFKKVMNDPQIANNIAGVIIEPIAGNMGVVEASKQFLNTLREETKRIGALLIFDEVINGFRVASGGAVEYFGIEPDLLCLGKIMGGGYPAAAFGAKREVMQMLAPEGPVYQAGTLSGNPIAMQAGAKALELLAEPGVYEELEAKTRLITAPIQQWIHENNAQMCVHQVGSMFTLFFGATKVENFDDVQQLNHKKFMEFFKHLLWNGVFIPPSQYEASFVSTAHTKEHLEKTRDVILDFLAKN